MNLSGNCEIQDLSLDEIDMVNGGDRGDAAVAGAVAGGMALGAAGAAVGGPAGAIAGFGLGMFVGMYVGVAIYDFGMSGQPEYGRNAYVKPV